MRHRPPKEAPAGYLKGSDIDLASWRSGRLAVDTAGEVYCFLGYQGEERRLDPPYYSPAVAARDNGGRDSFRFVRLRHGSIQYSSFFRSDGYYRVLDDRLLVLPSGAKSYFGVISTSDRAEDEKLTRAVFGARREDLETMVTAFAKIAGRQYHEYVQLPRVTFSKNRSNRCDISGCLIPEEFPYIAFEDAQYDWSHISLYGFYRLLSFLCPARQESPVRRALAENRVPMEVVEAIVSHIDCNALPVMFLEPL